MDRRATLFFPPAVLLTTLIFATASARPAPCRCWAPSSPTATAGRDGAHAAEASWQEAARLLTEIGSPEADRYRHAADHLNLSGT